MKGMHLITAVEQERAKKFETTHRLLDRRVGIETMAWDGGEKKVRKRIKRNYTVEDQCNPAAGVEDYVSQSQRCAFQTVS
jgi:hypothetical protein